METSLRALQRVPHLHPKLRFCAGAARAAGVLGSKATAPAAPSVYHSPGAVQLTLPRPAAAPVQIVAGLKEIKSRNDSVKNTKKITDAMKLVAAAKVRRAQDAVTGGRPFSEALAKVSNPHSAA